MTYNDLSFLVKERGMSIKSLAKDIGMTSTGLKKAFEEKTLQWKRMESLCEIFGITPNQFMSWPSDVQVGSGNYAANITGGNTQNSNEAIKALKDQLKEKDKQIGRLLTILEKSGSQSAQSDGGSYNYMAADNPVEYPKGKGNK